MKIFIISAILFYVSQAAYGITPSTTCPAGYKTISRPEFTLQTTQCNSGDKETGEISTCLSTSPTAICWMYAPANTTYSDDMGIYEFTEICPLK